MSAQDLFVGLLVALLIPSAWTGAVSAARALETGRWAAPFSDRAEKIVLALMLAPSALGALFLAWSMAPQPYAPPPSLLIDVAFLPEDAPAGAARQIAAPAFDWLGASVWALALVYACGCLWRAARLAWAHVRLARIAMGAADASVRWGRGAAVTDVRVSPFLAANGKVILPRSLIEKLAPVQIDLIVAHERSHQRRGDAIYYAALAWIDVLFWFNPLVRRQTERCRLAAEIACDAAASGAAPEMRRAYAQALVLALKHTAGDALGCAPAVFSTRSIGEHRMRIAQIMHSGAAARKRRPWAVVAAAALLIAPVAALQLAYAQPDAAPVAAPALAAAHQLSQPAPATLFSVVPVQGELHSAYGERPDPFTGAPAFHNGVDFRAPEGAPIVAPAAGRVRVADWQGGYGKLIEIDHGGGLVTRYAHLSAFEVSEGQQVAAGQAIGAVGSTGRNIGGPHLHFEVWRDGARIDPASVMRLQ